MSITTQMANRASGAFQEFPDETVHKDNAKAYFGTDGDASLKFNSTNDTLQAEGKAIEPSKGIRTPPTVKSADATLTQAELEAGMVIVDTTGKTVTLPAAAAALRNVKCLIAPAGAFATTIGLAAGSFGVGGATKDVATVPQGESALVFCESYDGGTTYSWFILGNVTLA